MATYLVTGANRGIGLAYCQALKERGETVIGVCRQSSDELDQLDIQVETNVDIGFNDSVSDLGKRLEGTEIDVLINNAGLWGKSELGNLDFEQIIHLFNVNTLGALRVTQSLLPNLKSGSKIAIMTSRMGSIGDNTSGNSYDYRLSKTALSMAGKSLAIDLKPRNIAVAILHPGLISTRMTNFQGTPPSEVVKGLLARIDELNMENTGTFWHSNGEVLPW